MVRTYKPYIPRSIGEVLDQLGFVFLRAPTFEDPAFPGQNIDSVFLQLNEGLEAVRKQLGEERIQKLTTLSDKARAHFESDPNDENGGAREGRRIIREMEEMLERM